MVLGACPHCGPHPGKAPVKALFTGRKTMAHRCRLHKYHTQNQNSNTALCDWVGSLFACTQISHQSTLTKERNTLEMEQQTLVFLTEL